MRQYLLYGLGAAILFAVSAGVSLWLRKPGRDADGDRASAAAKSAPDGPKDEADPKAAPRGAARPERPNPDETSSAMKQLRDREKAVRDREEALTSRQKKLELVSKDMHDEHEKLDELRKQIQAELQEANKKAADARRADADRQREAAARDEAMLRNRIQPPERTEDSDIGGMAAQCDTLSAAEAAANLQALAQTSGMDRAVKVLSRMRDPERVLQAMDPRLGNELTERARAEVRPAPVAPPQ
jgi:hypothetical protein